MNSDTDTNSTRSRWRVARWIAALVVVIAIGVGALFGSRLGTDPTLVDSPLVGSPVPDADLPNLESPGALSLADLRGQIVVINFWASWCVPCREEHPALLSAANNYRGSGVVFVGVSFQDQRDSAIAFLDELGRGDPGVYRYVTDPGSKFAMDLGVFGAPETFFIDRAGTVAAKITGASSYGLLADTLDALIAGRKPPA